MVALLASTATARTHGRAESAETQVERLAAEAVNAYRGADYNRAVELLTRAYEIRQVPALLYNLAKAYDKLGDVEHAYDAYRRYADSADADPKLEGKAEARAGGARRGAAQDGGGAARLEPNRRRRSSSIRLRSRRRWSRRRGSRRHRRRRRFAIGSRTSGSAIGGAIAASRSGSASAPWRSRRRRWRCR